MLALAFYNLHCLTLLFLFHLHVYNGFSLAAHLLSGHIMVLTDFQRPSYTSLLECFLLMVFRSIPSFALVCRMVIHLQTSGLLHGIKLKVILLNVVIRLLGCLAYITPFYFYFHIPSISFSFIIVATVKFVVIIKEFLCHLKLQGILFHSKKKKKKIHINLNSFCSFRLER